MQVFTCKYEMENHMTDETQQKIIDATMNLIMEKGYSSTTTKVIARQANVNECTIFRKFQGKKDIVLTAMKQKEWCPVLQPEDFSNCTWNLREDLERFARLYMQRVTPRFVKISIGLRSPELYPDTAGGIMQIPLTFKNGLLTYFEKMNKKGKLKKADYESLSMAFLSMCFGFVFLKASFEDHLTPLHPEEFIKASVKAFVKGIKE